MRIGRLEFGLVEYFNSPLIISKESAVCGCRIYVFLWVYLMWLSDDCIKVLSKPNGT